ncbi:hypothetical protein QN277_006151 [Acacia crassicarpa]|nr:hypothetical protein QN277_006151 [Acacia crassicarpa]
MPDCVKNYANGKTYEHDEVPAPIVANYEDLIAKPSRISCIRLGPKFSSHGDDENPDVRHVLFTHLGSETSGGSVHIMDLAEPLMPTAISPIKEVASFKCTLWTAEYDYTRPRAVIGTNTGAAFVDLETGRTSWFLHCKSDVFAEQIFNSGNSILCGLRNGAIIAIDFRERRDRFSMRRVTYPPLDKKSGSSDKAWFKLRGNCQATRMPSSISSLVSLQFDNQYFLASSMDGSVRLYDHRLLQRGAVQSYEGHVNSHTRIQLGVDPQEKFVMSGGEDCYLRLWSIKSGELLFEDKFSDTVLSTVCFRKYNYSDNVFNPEVVNKYMNDYPLGAWLASQEGFYYVNWFSM